MKQSCPPSFNFDALYGKSKVYILRALHAKQDARLDEYQLWAALALELLGKAALAYRHPSLVADPQHPTSLMAACGINVTVNVKTIGGHTVFDRLAFISKYFDKRLIEFAKTLAERRNAELHSGELPFHGINPEAWEERYWHTALIILESIRETLDEWIGADNAKAPTEIIKAAREAGAAAGRVKVQSAKDDFMALAKAKRELLINESKKLNYWNIRDEFDLLGDAKWAVECPSCTSKAYATGYKWSEEVSDEVDPEDPWIEFVEKIYTPEEIFCPTCGLHLNSVAEIEGAKMDSDYSEVDERRREYEEEYGNE